MEVILAIDQGTTQTRAVLFDATATPVAQAGADTPLLHPRPGWAENDPHQILGATVSAVKQVMAAAPSGTTVRAIGITNQRETLVAFDKMNARPLANAISWQCRRTTDRCAALRKDRRFAAQVRRTTGLVLDPYFSATKAEWFLKNVPRAREAARAPEEERGLGLGTVDAWLVLNLTGEFATDASNASRTMLFDIRKGRWDAALLRKFGVPASTLPEVRDSAGDFGKVRKDSFLGHELPELEGVPVLGVAGDQQASLFGHACLRKGEAKCTYGTGAFLLVNAGSTPVASRHGLLTTVAWRLDGATTYALEGSAFSCGSSIEWLKRVGLIADGPETEGLARSVEDAGGVTFVPGLSGLGAPHWLPDARAAFQGVSGATTRAHLVRAVLEGLALQNADLLDAMQRDARLKLRSLRVDGGVSRNRFLIELQAALIGVPVVPASDPDVTARGAALLAGIGAGLWNVKSLPEGGASEPVPPDRKPFDVKALRVAWGRALAAERARIGR